MRAPTRHEPRAELAESSLVDVLDRLLHKGVVVHGQLMLSLAGVDLVQVCLSTLLSTPGHSQRPSGPSPRAVRSVCAPRHGEPQAARARVGPRWNIEPNDAERSVVQLVLTLIELVRELLERQAMRRMDAQTLTPQQVEAVGLALMNLEKTVHDLAHRFGISPDDLNLDLGPLGGLV